MTQAQRLFAVPLHEKAREALEDRFASTLEECRIAFRAYARKLARGEPLIDSDYEIAKYIVDIAVPTVNKNLGVVKSVSGFQDVVGTHISRLECVFPRRRFRVYYRGIGCGRWQLTTSLDRKHLRRVEPDLLRELIISEPDEFRDVSSTFDQLALARHHSLPARLLDVTQSPQVALYFACRDEDPCMNDPEHADCPRDGKIHMLICPSEMVRPYDSDTVSVLAAMSHLRDLEEEVLVAGCPEGQDSVWQRPASLHPRHQGPTYEASMRRLFHFVAREKPYFENAIDPKDFYRVFVVEPRRLFTRLTAQSAAFLISGFHRRFEAEQIARNGPEFPIYDHYTIDVPRESKVEVIRQLGYNRINDETMMPGLEAVAEAIASRYR